MEETKSPARKSSAVELLLQFGLSQTLLCNDVMRKILHNYTLILTLSLLVPIKSVEQSHTDNESDMRHRCQPTVGGCQHPLGK